jgi:membrane-associated phospholipid phosphatase
MWLDSGEQSRLAHDWWWETSAFGGLIFASLVFVALLAFKQWHIAFQLFAGLVVVHVVVVTIRLLYFKERPKRQAHRSFIGRIDSSSFPSMHAMRTALYVPFAAHYGSFWLGLVAVALLVVVASSRLVLGKHDFTDVAVGAVVGCGIGLLALHLPIPF